MTVGRARSAIVVTCSGLGWLAGLSACARQFPSVGGDRDGATAESPPSGSPVCPTDDYGAASWETARGPFGGDRRAVVTDPADEGHLVTDSTDGSGIWESRDGGGRWARANPAGAPFAGQSTGIAALRDAAGREWLLVAQAAPAGGAALFRLPLASPAAGSATPLAGWDRGVTLLATDPAPARPGRIFVFTMRQEDVGADLAGGLCGSSADAGATWSRYNPGGRVEILIAAAFGSEGKILATSLLSATPDEFRRMIEERGGKDVLDLLRRLYYGSPAPAWIDGYALDHRPRLLRIEPATGAVLDTALVPVPLLDLAVHPGRPGVVWGSSRAGAFRSANDGRSFDNVPFALAGGASLRSPSPAGLTVADDPDGSGETVFLGNAGSAAGVERGLYRGRAGAGGAWIFERVSEGPQRRFLDWPKASVVILRANPRVLIAPYAEDGLRRSDQFGKPGSWRTIQGGLSGYNIFGVAEDPRDPRIVLATAQNVVRRSVDRIRSDAWDDRFVSLGSPTANLRGGLRVDPEIPARWIVGGGAGAGTSINGGVWITEDAGETWTRAIGEDGVRSNPQVWAIEQDPENPALVAFASARHLGEGTPGVFASLERGKPGTFARIVDGDHTALASLTGGRMLAGGAGGLTRLTLTGGAITAGRESWDGGVVTAVRASRGFVLVGSATGEIRRKPLGDLGTGTAWTLAASTGTAISDLEAAPARPGEIYAGTGGDGIWRSGDDGATWQRFDSGLESSQRVVFDLDLSACGDRLYAGTLGGLGVRKLPR